MSSHHIIRDEQEPALLVLDPMAIDREHFDALLEWSPTLIVTEEHTSTLLGWGIKIDRVLVKEGSELLNNKQDLFDVVNYQNECTSLDAGLDFLLKQNHHSVNIVGNPDNQPVFLHSLVNKMNCVLFETNSKIIVARNGVYRKWFKAYSSISIQSFEVMYLSSDGLMDELENIKVEDELRITTTDDGILSLKSNLKPFLVAEQL
ncbi:MAG: hypothetical protein AAGC88_03735 [Bacteroidota bacterium]